MCVWYRSSGYDRMPDVFHNGTLFSCYHITNIQVYMSMNILKMTAMYARSNACIRMFYMWFKEVKSQLFQFFCTNMSVLSYGIITILAAINKWQYLIIMCSGTPILLTHSALRGGWGIYRMHTFLYHSLQMCLSAHYNLLP